ncbi:MAG: hypothetical protein V3T83_00880 [Acidobacteriota bacterium]
MQNKFYRVFLSVEAMDAARDQSQKLEDERCELAAFPSLAEAQDFCKELVQHTAEATGESELLAEMTSPDVFSAGD